MPHPKGGYRLKDGTRVPGTTTIIGRFKKADALLYWACEQGKAIERGEISSLYDRRDAAADAGTIAHALVECHIANDDPAGVLDGIPPDIGRQAKQAYEAYLIWERTTKIKIVEQEIELVSETYRYGGCPDAIGEIDGLLYLIDWKTSNSVFSDMLLQLAAYRQLWEENFPDKPLCGYHLCRFSKVHADFAHHYYSELNDAWRLFQLYREAYDLDKIISKRV